MEKIVSIESVISHQSKAVHRHITVEHDLIGCRINSS
jgi:hypothetical protein